MNSQVPVNPEVPQLVKIRFEVFATVAGQEPTLIASSEDEAIEGDYVNEVCARSLDAMAAELRRLDAERHRLDVERLSS